MILNTGQRTDIPAFYSQWFMNRVRQGFVMVRNPYNQSFVTRYEINADVVDLICFCSKNPAPMLPYIKELSARGFAQLWHVTITPYGKDIEPNVPDKHKIIEAFQTLSALVGKDRIVWRYDPIFINEKYSADYHRRAFDAISRSLSDFTNTCVISFIDIFPQVKINFPEIRAVSPSEMISLGKDLIDIARARNINVISCAEGSALGSFGAKIDGCMSARSIEKAVGSPLEIPKYKPSRKTCGCYLSCDIGAYSSCLHFCRYCYASSNRATITENYRKHNPDSPFLLGTSMEGDSLHQAEQKSWKISPTQLSLF